MTNLAAAAKMPGKMASPRRDTIHILHEVFPTEVLNSLVKCLEEDGHRCVVFKSRDGIQDALSDPRTKLLLFGIAEDGLPRLIEALRSGGGKQPDIPVLVYLEDALHNSPKGLLVPEIDDFLLGPLNLWDVRLRVRRLVQPFVERNDEVERVKLSLLSHFGMRQFIGKAPAFLEVVEKIPRIAACDATVLITGDTGTGKEMCARAIHYLSPRAGKPFTPINCSSIPADLFENEMFGHEPGAFTDARHSRRGLIAEAEGGTLFLDEVDSLPPSTQAKLLRFLQDRQYRPLGASNYRQANTRLLAASNQNLQNKVLERAFREDLYYRLKVVSLWLPALRDRREDILPLALHFLKTSACEYNRPVARFSHNASQALLSYTWPGNVRELENVVRQAVVLAEGPMIQADDLQLPADSQSSPALAKEPFKVAKARVIEAFERTYLTEVVAAAGGNISQAARAAKKDRRTFFALLKKYGLSSTYRSQLS